MNFGQTLTRMFRLAEDRNAMASILGRVWVMALTFITLPIFLHLLGNEAYGVIGFFAVFTAVFSIFDLGLPQAVNWNLARKTDEAGNPLNLSALLRYSLVLYMAFGIAAGCIALLVSHLIQSQFLKSDSLDADMLHQVVILMSVALLAQWPANFYRSALTGIHQLVCVNIWTMIIATFRMVGVIAILNIFGATLITFFLWYIFSFILESIVLWWEFQRRFQVSDPDHNRFSKTARSVLIKFSLTLWATKALIILLGQFDKTIVSSFLTLTDFSAYSIAWMVAIGVGFAILPLQTAAGPHFASLVQNKDQSSLSAAMYRQSKFVALLTAPLAFCVMEYMQPLVAGWLQNSDLVNTVAPVAQILVIGTILQIFTDTPRTMSVAMGKSTYEMRANLMALIILVPVAYVLTKNYGLIGAAWALPIYRLGMLILYLPFLFARILPGGYLNWFIYGPLGPVLIAGAAVKATDFALGYTGFNSVPFASALLAFITGSLFAFIWINLTKKIHANTQETTC